MLNVCLNSTPSKAALCKPALGDREGNDCHGHTCWNKHSAGAEVSPGGHGIIAATAMEGWGSQGWVFLPQA